MECSKTRKSFMNGTGTWTGGQANYMSSLMLALIVNAFHFHIRKHKYTITDRLINSAAYMWTCHTVTQHNKQIIKIR